MTNRKYGSTSFMGADALFHFQRAKAASAAFAKYQESAPGLADVLAATSINESMRSYRLMSDGRKTK